MGFLPWFRQFLPCLVLFHLHLEATETAPSGHHEESLALLQFLQPFTISTSFSLGCFEPHDPYPKTKSWKEETNCCSWDGVTCDSETGHVIVLDLSCSMLQGNIHPNSSLFFLRHLQKLDLSFNDFNGSYISPNFGQFLNLSHLHLNSSSFAGQVPPEISRLSRLVSIDLSENFFLGIEASTFNNLAQNLTNLQHLNLNMVDMSLAMPSSLMNLSSSLLSLELTFCRLHGEIPSDIFNSSSLQLLNLMGNQLKGTFASSTGSALRYLDLSATQISVSIDDDFTRNLRSLKILHLKDCKVTNPNLPLLGNLTQLTELVLSDNGLTGLIPSSFGVLTQLTSLDISNNNFNGPIPSFLGNLTQLEFLQLSANNFVGKIPVAFANLTQLYDLNLSNNQLKGLVPFQIGLLSILSHLDLSNNFLGGTILSTLFRDHGGQSLYTSLQYIDLSKNELHGRIPSSISKLVNLRTLVLSSNKLIGKVPTSICNLKFLRILDLSNNSLSSFLPQCLGSFSSSLSVLHLNKNKFQGRIPAIYFQGNSLRYINLNGNQLEGKIPKSLINCTSLELVDLGDNNIEDTFPYFLATLPELQVLVLRSNKLHGSLNPAANLSFYKLQILDVFNNNLSDQLPIELFNNLKALMDVDQDEYMPYMSTENFPFEFSYYFSVEATVKGSNIELEKILPNVGIIDLSCNKFTGKIPDSVGKLKSLRLLNLSHNSLVGEIHPSLGNLTSMESLDLSFNLLSGRIPEQLLDLTFLQVLNLSYNRLNGLIPQGKQFDTFGSDSYEGNLGLYGCPLAKACKKGERRQEPAVPLPNLEENDCRHQNGFGWKVVCIGYGFGLIFGLTMGELILSRTRKPSWFMRLLNVKNQR